MSDTIFFRLLDGREKASALAESMDREHSGDAIDGATFLAAPEAFRTVPRSPFAYWVEDHVFSLFAKMPSLESGLGEARVGGQCSDDFRYLRCFWEVDAEAVGTDWYLYQKGGEYSRYYADIHLIVDWDADRQTYRGFHGRIGRANEKPSGYQHYFRAGLTWSRRSQAGLSLRGSHPLVW